ncbi:hypothetical protein F751_6074 [Auxenochlorella protothecoides]|uniref:Large ribosomal subunit protein mL53 n=2 Tax=Auxenochlorella protothecoides TaxID=3075 RepID=A0A087SP39_AUXPR|nr:hypothetical protein F751_6074 [Auxenochlorella protothecoides]KFM27493.1 hypothetical protein F751_6074 [Auxenochlorella protothecoides]
MAMQLKHIAKVFVQLSPLSGEARSAREFLARATSRKALESNPACEVSQAIRLNGENFVEVTYASKQVVRISTKDLKIDDIMSRINGVAEDMDMQERLKAAGLDGQKVISTWNSGGNRERDMGTVSFQPRQA